MIRGKRFAQPEGLVIGAFGVADSGCGTARQHSKPSATADDRTPTALTKVTISLSGAAVHGLAILFHGSVKGGTVGRVKARNPALPSIDASVKLKVTATAVH